MDRPTSTNVELRGSSARCRRGGRGRRHRTRRPRGSDGPDGPLLPGPFGEAPQHLPYRRAAMLFMRWQLRREALEPPLRPRPGSRWWRAVNERILRDGCEAVAPSGSLPGPVSSPTIDHWMAFVDDPTARSWYRRTTGASSPATLEHRDLAEAENAAERFFMNVVLCRVLSPMHWSPRPGCPSGGSVRSHHSSVTRASGWRGSSCSCRASCRPEYPLRDGVATYLDAELGFGQLVDYGVIVPRLQQLYEWSADESGCRGLLECVRHGALTYVWLYEERDVWRAPDSLVVRVVHRTLPPARNEVAMADGSAAQKRRRVRWIQRFLLNPPAKVAVWCGLVPGFVLVETTGRRSGKRRRNVVGAHRRRHGLGVRRARPTRGVRAQPRSQPRRPGPHAPPLAPGPGPHRGRRRSAGPAGLVRQTFPLGRGPALRNGPADHPVRVPNRVTIGRTPRATAPR